MKFLYLKDKIKLAEYDLIMPSVSYYLLDRCIIDVLLQNIPDVERFAYLVDPNIAPFYGVASSKHPVFEGHVYSAELFVSRSQKRAFLQLRSYFYCPNSLIAKNLARFIEKKKFKTVTVISSASDLFFDDSVSQMGAIISKMEMNDLNPVVHNMNKSFAFRKAIFPCNDFTGYFPKLRRAGMTFKLVQNLPDSAICLVVFIEAFMQEPLRSKAAESLAEYFGLSKAVSDDIFGIDMSTVLP